MNFLYKQFGCKVKSTIFAARNTKAEIPQ